MKNNLKHVRHHAVKHNEAHEYLKNLLDRPFKKEKLWPVFLGTFLVTLMAIFGVMNGPKIVDFFTPEPAKELPQVHGFQSGIVSTYKLEKQTWSEYDRYLASVPSFGHLKGLIATHYMGEDKTKPAVFYPTAIKNAAWMTNYLSTGQHLTKLNQKRAQALQKSIITTTYLGDKTIGIEGTLANDTLLLTQINNALSVDLFQFLNQSNDRSATLNNYLNLLELLSEKSTERINELNSKINFLSQNANVKEVAIKTNEQEFFNHLKNFNGENAEESLADFIGLDQEQTEIRAKMGAYQGLKDYYIFFQPRLDQLIREIRLNRDPLIAGVKVVEIQNMMLPLIIKQ